MNKKMYLSYVFLMLLFFNPMAGNTQSDRLQSIEDGLKAHFEEYSKFRITYSHLKHVEPILSSDFSPIHVSRYKDVLARKKLNQLTQAEEKEFENFSEKDIEELISSHERMLSSHTIHTIKVYSTDGVHCRVDGFRFSGSPKHFYHLFDQFNGYLVTVDKDVTVRPSQGYTRQWVTPLYPVIFGSGIGRYFNYELRLTSEDVENNSISISYQNRGNDIVAKYTLLERDSPYWSKCDIYFGETLVKSFHCESFSEHNGLKIPEIVKEFKGDKLVSEYQLEEVETNVSDFGSGFFSLPNNEGLKVFRSERS